VAVTYRRDRERAARERRRRASAAAAASEPRVDLTRDGALRRIAAAVSARTDLATLFDDVIDHTVSLFSVERAALWLVDDDVHPFRLAAHRGLSPALREAVAALTMDSPANGVEAARDRTLRVVQDAGRTASSPELREVYARDGIETVCFVPIVFRERLLGLLVLYHETRREWPAEELELAAAFADQMAVAIENTRLYEATVDLAARLRAIQDLGARLNRIQDVRGIGEAIVAEARSLIDHDNIRVYRVDHAAGTCEPIAFQGAFMGVDEPTPEMLRCRVGEGLTGWVAEHNQALVVGDAETDPRRLLVGPTDGPESMLLVPMAYDDRVEGVIVLAKLGRDRFTRDHEATLTIFAGHAAQAFVNADNAERVRRQQLELEHQLANQRRLLEVNETLLSTLDPRAVLEMIADSLKEVVAYDTLTIYRVDKEAGVRRAVVARDRFADVIMDYAGPLGVGITGWVIDRNEAVLANDAHLDPRSVQIPGTPFEPESMIVVPLRVGGEVIGTLNIGRMGEAESHFDEQEFELTQLFGGQASIALQNAETHRAVEVRADRDALTGLYNHGAFQRGLGAALAAEGGPGLAVLMMDLDAFKAFNDTHGHPAGDALLHAIGTAIVGAIRDDGQAYRYGGDEFAAILPAMGRSGAEAVAERIRTAVAATTAAAETDETAPTVTISVGIATFPHDGRAKDALVRAADADLYRVKPADPVAAHPETVPADAYLAALNETAVALMDRLDPTELLGTIVQRAGALVGTSHGFVYLVDPIQDDLVIRVGTGLYADYVDHRLARDVGLSGVVWTTGRPYVVADYDDLPTRDPGLPRGLLGSVVGIPLASRGEVMGVLGLASGGLPVTFGEREVAVLERFAELASLALDNARLLESAKREVAERARAEEALRASEERYRRLSDATSEALAIHREGRILEVNAAFSRLLGYEAADCLGRTILDFAAPETAAAIRNGEYNPESTAPLEVLARHRDGTVFPVEVAWRHIPYPDGEQADVVSVRDLRERRRLEAELSRSAFYDGLTGLPNRALLLDRVSHALSFTRPDEAVSIAFILLDLDRFKVINESLGHAAGDRLLDDVGRRLSECLRPGDTVARFGGDEFAILLDTVHDADDALRVAERIEHELRAPFDLDGRDTFVAASLGIALGRAGATEPGDLLRDAEIALYRAKADTTSRHAVYEPSMSAAAAERLDLETDLRRAIERDEFQLEYQPLVDLATDRVVGLEALVRWQHPTRGLVPPLAFIPLAEETGLIVPIGRWVLETACRRARSWQLEVPGREALQVSVNLSAKQFAQPDLAELVAGILAETGLDPSSLELEITESVLMDESEAGIRALRALREIGVRLVLDDFGTGYSSLSYLKHLPLDTIKIDRSFVVELTGDDANLPIVHAVISLAHGLGIEVVAEGIETAEQLGWLRQLACDRGQGFYFARPLPAERLTELLRADRPLGGPAAEPSAVRLATDRPARRRRSG
jgi:diguanylate cyclase (GGDEF)-like protein/PAS domain S-box-containing protein